MTADFQRGFAAAREAAAAECDALALVIERKGFNVDAKPLRAAAERIRSMEPEA